MIATPHLLGGAVIGSLSTTSRTNNTLIRVAIIFIAGIFSHFLLDAVPHGEEIYHTSLGTAPVLFAEIVVVSNLIFWMSYVKNLDLINVFAGVAGAACPDFISIASRSLGGPQTLEPFVSFHVYFHSVNDPEPAVSVILQFAIAAIFFSILCCVSKAK